MEEPVTYKRLHPFLGVLFFAGLHFASLSIAYMTFACLVGNRWETNRPASLVETIAWEITNVLAFPGFQWAKLVRIHANGAELLVVFGNSLLWGMTLYWSMTEVKRILSTRRISLRHALTGLTIVAVALGLGAWLIRITSNE
jgi:hypothetical protein